MRKDKTRIVERGGEAGISMIEISMVFLMILIVLAFALPAVSNSIRAYNLRSAANHIAERLTAVRALAMAKNKSVTFSFNNTSRQYGFDFTGPEGDGVPDVSDPDDPSASYYSERLPEGVTTTFPDNTPIKVTFSSRGEMPIGNREQSIAIQNNGKTATVRVNLRGRITVE